LLEFLVTRAGDLAGDLAGNFEVFGGALPDVPLSGLLGGGSRAAVVFAAGCISAAEAGSNSAELAAAADFGAAEACNCFARLVGLLDILNNKRHNKRYNINTTKGRNK
jgi:hypothetical protein